MPPTSKTSGHTEGFRPSASAIGCAVCSVRRTGDTSIRVQPPTSDAALSPLASHAAAARACSRPVSLRLGSGMRPRR
eukprot:5123217-Prymnesium_polylepis.1